MEFAANFFTIATGLIASVALIGSISYVTRWVLIVRLVLGKVKILRRLRTVVPGGSGRRASVHSLFLQASGITRGRPYSVAEELKWLSSTAGTDGAITFDPEAASSLRELSDLYARFSTGLQFKTLILGGSQPLLEYVAHVAQDVGRILAIQTRNLPVDELTGSTAASRWTEYETAYTSKRPGSLPGSVSKIYLETLSSSAQGVAHDLQVSWIPSTGSTAAESGRTPDHPRHYNGLLPLLRRHRYERSLADGNYRIHLELGEIHYDQHREISDPRKEVGNGTCRGLPMLLTFCVLPVTLDGYFIVARRGDVGYYPNCWGPGAGGNLEMPSFGSAVDDLDRYGVVDPLKALAREMNEEIGIGLPQEQVQPLGMAQVSNAEERGTYLMAALAVTGMTLAEFSRATAQANAVTGRWEVGDRLVAIPLPKTEEDAQALASWVLDDPGCMPHLAINILQLISFTTSFEVPVASPRRSSHGIPAGAVFFQPGSVVGGGDAAEQDDTGRPGEVPEVSLVRRFLTRFAV